MPVRTQRSLKNRGPGHLGCGRPRLPRLHRDRGRPTTRGALRRVLTRRALGHWQTSPALASKPRGARYLDRGTTRWNSRAPARQGPSPEERHPVYPQRFNWFESTPRNAPRLPIQTNNHTTSEPHTHVMSNENKFPLKETTFAKKRTIGLGLELGLGEGLGLGLDPSSCNTWQPQVRRQRRVARWTASRAAF